MKVYFVEIDGENGISCFADPADVLEYLQPTDDDYPDMRDEIIEARKVLSAGKGCFEGDYCSAWVAIKSRKWFESLPKDEEDESCSTTPKS
jgi:hypothetical protein